MTKLLRLALAFAITFSPLVASAQINTEGLTRAQIAELDAARASIVAKNAANNVTVVAPNSTAEKVNEWIEVGQGVGAGLASAARELGLVANEFAQTPVGQITIALIIYKVAGGDLIQLMIGLMWLLILIPGWTFFYRKTWAPKSVTINYGPDGKKVSKEVVNYDMKDDDVAGYRVWGIVPYFVILVISIPIIFA